MACALYYDGPASLNCIRGILMGRDLPKAAAVIILVAKLATLLNLYGSLMTLLLHPNFTKCGQAWRYTAFHIDYNPCHLYCSVRKCPLLVEQW